MAFPLSEVQSQFRSAYSTMPVWDALYFVQAEKQMLEVTLLWMIRGEGDHSTHVSCSTEEGESDPRPTLASYLPPANVRGFKVGRCRV